jgi:aryl-phospho-beta-D-glucosidase BglC (GH1 family)
MAFFSATSPNEQYSNQKIRNLDLKWIRDWGFDYVRLPIDYWFFVDGDWRTGNRMDIGRVRNVDEKALEKLDRAVEQCMEYGLHITVNMHRAPGYCINGWDREPFNLWKDADAEDAFAFWWDLIARRYQGISADKLSFNLVNEAPGVSDKMSLGDYRRVMLRAQRLIHSVSPDRTVIIDGTAVGRDVVTNMIGEPVAQAFHAYDPFRLTHYKASWVGDNDHWAVPQWPMHNPDGSISGETELRTRMAPWAELARQGVGVHCGECGCYNKTPHAVFIDWFSVVLDLLKEHDIGWALWNFRGAFGVLDSERNDVDYEDWYGHKLDRKLLQILQQA